MWLSTVVYPNLVDVTTTAGARDAAKRLVDSARTRLESEYGKLPTTSTPLPPATQERVALVLTQAQQAGKVVTDVSGGPGLFEYLKQGLQTTVQTASTAVATVAHDAAGVVGETAWAALKPLAPVLLILGVGIAAVLILKPKVAG